MDRPARRRHRGKPSPRADRDRRSLGLYRRDVCRRRQRARPDRARHRDRSRDACARHGSRRSPPSSAKRRCRCRRATGCSRAAATAGTASISAISSASCNRCSARFRGRHGSRRRTAISDLRQRAWDAAAAVVDPEIPVLTIADLGVLREVAVTRRPCRGRDHADLFRLPGDEHDRARDRAGAGARRHCASQKSAPCCRRPGPPTG